LLSINQIVGRGSSLVAVSGDGPDSSDKCEREMIEDTGATASGESIPF